MKPIKAITLRLLPAVDVLFEGKRVENRTWHTDFRGPLYLHVSTKDSFETPAWRAEFERCYDIKLANFQGHLVGTMSIVDCTKKTPKGQRKFSQVGLWHFILEDVRILRVPIRMKGQLGIWNVKPTGEDR